MALGGERLRWLTSDCYGTLAQFDEGLMAARDVGFRCIWIDRDTGRRPLPDYVPDETFARLDAVPALFERIGRAS